MKSKVLITGAASLVGAELVKALGAHSEVKSIVLLTPADETERRRELTRLEAYLGSLPISVTTLAADWRLPRFGLSPAAWDDLDNSFDLAFHCAQRDIKDQDLDHARQTNVAPLSGWLELLLRNSELRLHYLSTAFIGGTRHGLLTEFDLNCGQGFNNAGERSMFEAEEFLRTSPVTDRINVYRTSHTLGRADTGEAFELGGAYALIATLAASRILPGDPRARIDFVPADFVANSIVALAGTEARGTFHLACGWETSLTIREAADVAAQGRGRARGARLLPRGIAWPSRLAGTTSLGGLASSGQAFRSARALLHQGPVFDTYRADRALTALGIDRPDPRNWLESTVRHAEMRGWEAPPAYAANGFAR